jgi:hypothetical protein
LAIPSFISKGLLSHLQRLMASFEPKNARHLLHVLYISNTEFFEKIQYYSIATYLSFLIEEKQ